ncbi:hypothetical protein Shyd_95580 [Streptomyces hydrogenans]|uniref:Uncharacterized protein n=1 Tax=Streptomyces hydrogenans TaxID=1873719 RepID=A0ABQ3PT47_9ACTN|nr:hypothetical protein GCM10018784_06340 [Streptomyces hydrogenans]GHI28187.1 hypothetical protein Shyd_95580 [Streptomyces hydrogenans]
MTVRLSVVRTASAPSSLRVVCVAMEVLLVGGEGREGEGERREREGRGEGRAAGRAGEWGRGPVIP